MTVRLSLVELSISEPPTTSKTDSRGRQADLGAWLDEGRHREFRLDCSRARPFVMGGFGKRTTVNAPRTLSRIGRTIIAVHITNHALIIGLIDILIFPGTAHEPAAFYGSKVQAHCRGVVASEAASARWNILAERDRNVDEVLNV